MKAPANHMTPKDIVGLGVVSRRTLGRLTRLKIFHPRRLGHRTLWYPVRELEEFFGCGFVLDNGQWRMHGNYQPA